MMNNLAVVIVSCDAYSWFWTYWYYYFAKNFGFDYPVYLLSETRSISLDNVTVINSEIRNVSHWTKRLRESVAQIPYDNLFVMCDDFLIKADITEQFTELYDTFKSVGADSLRIMADRCVGCIMQPTDLADDIEELMEDSPYKISYSPNIWKKSFLLKCIQEDESPWTNEIQGSMRVRRAYLLSIDIPGWYVGAIRRGQLIPEGKQLIEKI